MAFMFLNGPRQTDVGLKGGIERSLRCVLGVLGTGIVPRTRFGASFNHEEKCCPRGST